MAKKTPKKDGKNKLFVDVVATAVEFHKRRLWHHVDSADPISIRVEGEEHPLVCFVLGRGGMELGVSALRGELALEAFEDVILTGGRLAADAPCDLLLLSFDLPTEVDADFLRPLQQSGRVFGKNSAAPIFVAKKVGENSRPMTRPELRIMQTILRTLLLAASSGQLQQRQWDWKRRTLELALEGKGKKARVLDSVRTWPPLRPEEEREVRTPVLPERWYDSTKAAPRTGATWGAVLVPAPPTEDDPTPRELLLVRDERSGSMLAPHMVTEGDPDELAEALLDLFELGPLDDDDDYGLPHRILFQSPRPMRQMRSALDELSIEVDLDREQPELMDMMSQMLDALEEGLQAQGLLDEVEPDDSESFSSWKDADTRLSTHLMQTAAKKHGALKARPLNLFFGDAAQGRALVMDEEDPTPGVAYFEWFALRHRARRGAPTIAEQILREGRLPALQQRLLEARIQAKCIVGRIVEIDPGAWIEVENVLTGEVHRIHDVGLSSSVREGLGLILEIYPAGEWMFTMVAGPPLPSMAIEHALRRIEAIGYEFEDGVLMGDRDHMGELFIHPPMNAPVMQNTDGEALESLTVSFALEPSEDIDSVLNPLDEMEDNEDGTWTWLAPGNGKPGYENGVVYAHFEQVGDELLASVNSAPRSLKVKDLLSHAPGVKFLSIHPTPEPENAPSSIPGNPAESMAPELQAELERLLHERAMASLDEPVPAFGGKTYREAARSPELRAEVERMIRTYPDAGSPNGPIRMPREEMLRELGLQ